MLHDSAWIMFKHILRHNAHMDLVAPLVSIGVDRQAFISRTNPLDVVFKANVGRRKLEHAKQTAKSTTKSANFGVVSLHFRIVFVLN